MKIKLTFFEDKFGVGGIERFILNTCSNINLNKYDISIVVVNKLTNRYDNFFNSKGIELIELLDYKEENPFLRFLKGVPKFSKYLKENKQDIIHFNLSDAVDLLYVEVAKRNGIKIRIAHSHNSSVNSCKKKIVHNICKFFLKNTPNYFISCSSEAAKWLFPKEIYSNKEYELLPNAIYLNQYKYSKSRRDKVRNYLSWSNKIIFGNVGRFNLQKNHKFLIDIFDKISKKISNSILVLVGDGELKANIEAYVKKKGLENRVLFLGNSDNVADLLQAIDVFILPSLYEGLPFVLVESQAASLPAIVSDNITKEVRCTDYINFVSLRKSPEEWADIAISMSSSLRHDTIKQMTDAGFSVYKMTQKLDYIYFKLYEERYGK